MTTCRAPLDVRSVECGRRVRAPRTRVRSGAPAPGMRRAPGRGQRHQIPCPPGPRRRDSRARPSRRASSGTCASSAPSIRPPTPPTVAETSRASSFQDGSCHSCPAGRVRCASRVRQIPVAGPVSGLQGRSSAAQPCSCSRFHAARIWPSFIWDRLRSLQACTFATTSSASSALARWRMTQ